jgi:hypothetical protein
MVLIIVLVPDWKITRISLTPANVEYRVYRALFIFDSKKFRCKWANERLASPTGIVVTSLANSIYYFVSLFVLSIMNIEPVNTQQAFLRLSLPIVFDNTELLKCIAG